MRNKELRPLCNAGLLQFRQVVIAAVDLIALRFVLSALGEVEYGVFSAVTGVVASLALLHGVLQTLALRFLSVGFARGEGKPLSVAFASVFSLALAVGALMAVLGEAAFLPFVEGRMAFPDEMRSLVPWVFRIALATIVLQTLQLPFVALMVASEKLGFLLKTTAIDVLVALASAGFVVLWRPAGVIGYAAALCLGSSVLLAVYAVHCRRAHPEISFVSGCRLSELREQGGFFLWSLLSTGANTLKYQGVGVLVNLYAGVLSSASWGVAMKVGFGFGLVIGNFQQGFQPKLVRLWRANDREGFWRLTASALRWTFLMAALPTLPLVIWPHRALACWLGPCSLPDVEKVVAVIAVHYLVDALTGPLTTAIVATGRIARYQVGVSLAMGSGFFFAWLALALGCPVWTAAASVAFANLLSLVQRLVYMRNCMGLAFGRFLRHVLLP